MRILTCYNNIMHPGIAKLVSRLVWDQETVRSSRTTRTNEKRDSEIADFRVPFPCSNNLIICPVSLLENWKRECGKFAPDIDVYVHHGPRRTGLYKEHL